MTFWLLQQKEVVGGAIATDQQGFPHAVPHYYLNKFIFISTE